MNRYQLEVARMDRRRRLVVRATTFVAVVTLAALAAWSTGPHFGTGTSSSPRSADVSPQAADGAKNISEAAPVDARASTAHRLRLVSTAPGRNVHEGTAQLGEDLAHPQTYGAGALLENGAVLKEIHSDHVLLERGGVTSALYIEGVAERPDQKRSVPMVESVLLLSSDTARPVGPTGPPTYTHLVRAAPHFENDVVVGFDVYPGTQAAQFARLGLQSGDLLLNIDGAPVGDVSVLNAALRDLTEGRSMTATVRRGGKHVEVSLDNAALERPPDLMGQAR